MIYSYDKVYLRIAQRVLGEMLNYAVYDCGYELNEYYRLFTESSYSERFSKGDPFVIAGMSGAELPIRVRKFVIYIIHIMRWILRRECKK